jgi:bifunctional DNase/RNase
MANIEMVIDSIRTGMMNYPRTLVLREKDGARYLPICVGTAEADAIAVKTQQVETPRPLTHEFMSSVIDALGADLESANIDKLENSTFYARIVLRADKERKEIDCRPSDALAVAVRRGAPIFADEEVLNKASISVDEVTGELFELS